MNKWEEKIQRNWELLQLYIKLEQLDESCWGKLCQFEKLYLFMRFEKKYSIPPVLQLRLDDFIYALLLVVMGVVFCVLPSQDDHLLTTAYRQYVIFYLVGSVLWLLSAHWYKHLVMFFFYAIFPTLVYLVYNNVSYVLMQIIVLDQIDSNVVVESYLGLLSLWGVYGFLYIVYPLKEFIRNKLGALYSYLYALSMSMLFVMWCPFSLMEGMVTSGQVDWTFITQNQPLIICFLVIIVLSFHLFTHHVFFTADLKGIREVLRGDFRKKKDMIDALEEARQRASDSCFYANWNIYARVMSFMVFGTTLAMVVYGFIYLSNHLDPFHQPSVGVMLFPLVFVSYGSIINVFKKNPEIVVLIFTLVSLVPVCFSPLYRSLPTYQYIFLATFLPYITVFWCIIRTLSPYRPILKIHVIIILYMFLHVPISIFIINALEMFTTDANTLSAVNIFAFAITGVAILAGVVSFIVWLCVSVKELPSEEVEREKILDYNYYQQGEPTYVPYKKLQSFSLAWLASLDIRSMGLIFASVCFVGCELTTFFVFNQLETTLQSYILVNAANAQFIVYAQFFLAFAFYAYSYLYIMVQPLSVPMVGLYIVTFVGAVIGITLSYTIDVTWAFSLRVCGGFCAALFLASVGLSVLKNKAVAVAPFVCPVLIMIAWTFFLIPYAIVVPILSIYFEQEFFLLVYGVILASVLLLVFLVTSVSVIFNMLMNKFEEEKKIKFIMEDVQTYLSDEGISLEDEVMHIMYESYEYRDRKYVFFMKRGYPIRLWREEKQNKAIIYTQEESLRKSLTSYQKENQEKYDNCWLCLTFCCGKDDDQIADDVNKAVENKIIDEEELEGLFAPGFLKAILKNSIEAEEAKKKVKDLSEVYSTKSLILRHLNKIDRKLGDEYSLLKMKNKKIVIQIWHQIFNFIANNDDPPKKVIYNDFLIFCKVSQFGFGEQTVSKIFRRVANSDWNDFISIDIAQFALAIECLAKQFYKSRYNQINNAQSLLIEKIYYNLCQYNQFQDIMNNKQFKKNIKLYEKSPFEGSYERFLKFDEDNREKDEQYERKLRQYQQGKLIQPGAQMSRRVEAQQQQIFEKKKSCKRSLYDCYLSMRDCCSKKEQQTEITNKTKMKPWQLLATECIRIIQHKQTEWKQNNKKEQFEFKCIFNNILVAILKLLDLYMYLEITIMNPNVGWQSFTTFSILLIDYRIQLYIAFGLVLLCSVLGIRGIAYIFEDRLGLTEARIPAAFPHPMFFFTVVYKLLILSLFNTIVRTLMNTFACDWTLTANQHTVIFLNNSTGLGCFSEQHNIYIIFSLISLILYYLLSSYTMPNFQFSEKRLDLKFKPTYLIIYFQVNFLLAAIKVLLFQIDQTSNSETLDYAFFGISVGSLCILALCVIFMKPCLISWFNFVEFLIIWIGIVWNCLGMVLYAYGQGVLWICAGVGIGVTVLSIIIVVVFIRRKYFSDGRVHAETDNEQIEQLEQRWEYKKQHGVHLMRQENISSQQIGTQQESKKKIDMIGMQMPVLE